RVGGGYPRRIPQMIPWNPSIAELSRPPATAGAGLAPARSPSRRARGPNRACHAHAGTVRGPRDSGHRRFALQPDLPVQLGLGPHQQADEADGWAEENEEEGGDHLDLAAGPDRGAVDRELDQAEGERHWHHERLQPFSHPAQHRALTLEGQREQTLLARQV